MYVSLYYLSAIPSLSDSLVQPIPPIIVHRCYIRSDRLLSGVWSGLWVSPAHYWLLHSSRARLWPSYLLCIILAFEGNGRRSMWWMAFMRAEYRWLKDSELWLWAGKRQPECITAPTPSPWFFSLYFPVICHSLLHPLFSSSASYDWSLTQTLVALWIRSSSISLLLPIKQSSHNDGQNGDTWQSAAAE